MKIPMWISKEQQKRQLLRRTMTPTKTARGKWAGDVVPWRDKGDNSEWRLLHGLHYAKRCSSTNQRNSWPNKQTTPAQYPVHTLLGLYVCFFIISWNKFNKYVCLIWMSLSIHAIVVEPNIHVAHCSTTCYCIDIAVYIGGFRYHSSCNT